MIDAVVGSVIMVIATTSLVFTIELSEKGFGQSGYQRLSPYEVRLVNGVARPSPNGDSFPDADSFQENNQTLFVRQ